ncbi:MAG: hypothetical protein LBC38_03470 [Oscillospiraceae bacterium]|jgi:hypothetical protein|nr:hypothetical protein [Oscillospiraceae bacterium]
MNTIRSVAGKLARNKIFLAVISILASFLIWMWTVNAENTDSQLMLRNLPVVYEGEEELLASSDLIITNKNTETITLELRDKRNVLSKLNSSNVRVVVDVSTIRATGEFQSMYKVEFDSSVDTSKTIPLGDPDAVTINVERLISRDVPVKGKLVGSVADGFVAENMKYSPEVLTVRGPNSIVSRVEYAQVTLVRDSINATVADKLTPELYDADGNVIEKTELVTFNYDTVRVELPVKSTKEIGLIAKLIPGGGADIDNADVQVTPTTITIKGDPSILNDLNVLVLTTIDLSRVNGRITETYAIPFPEGTEGLSGETTADITVTISGLETLQRVAAIKGMRGTDPGYNVELMSQSIPVTLRGPAEDLKEIDESMITATVDVSTVATTPGTHTIPPEDITITVQGYPDTGVLMNVHSITVVVSEASTEGDGQ